VSQEYCIQDSVNNYHIIICDFLHICIEIAFIVMAEESFFLKCLFCSSFI
jgi:hypothetical protein